MFYITLKITVITIVINQYSYIVVQCARILNSFKCISSGTSILVNYCFYIRDICNGTSILHKYCGWNVGIFIIILGKCKHCATCMSVSPILARVYYIDSDIRKRKNKTLALYFCYYGKNVHSYTDYKNKRKFFCLSVNRILANS